MNSEFVLTQGAGQKLEFAVQRNGGNNTDVDWLSTGDNFATVMLIARSQATVTVIKHVIDCDADPFTPDGWKVEEHRKGGQVKLERRGDDLYINDRKVELYLHEGQLGGKSIKGYKLRDAITKQEVLNACVLDYLFAHPELIPDSWKKNDNGNTRFIYFWGTIYRDSGGFLCVRCLYWSDGRWYWFADWLGGDWDGSRPAVLLASKN